MAVPTDTTVILYKGDEISPRLHPIDIESWLKLGWKEKKEEVKSNDFSAPLPIEPTIVLYRGEEQSPPLHQIDAGTWMGLGWTESQEQKDTHEIQEVSEDEQKQVEAPAPTPKAEEPTRRRTSKVDQT